MFQKQFLFVCLFRWIAEVENIIYNPHIWAPIVKGPIQCPRNKFLDSTSLWCCEGKKAILMLFGSPCLDLDLNSLLSRRNFWSIPGMLENYTIPKWKEFFKSREPILRKSYLSTFIHINKHMDGAGDIFWIKSLNGTFLALQIKSFGPKKFWFSCMGKN